MNWVTPVNEFGPTRTSGTLCSCRFTIAIDCASCTTANPWDETTRVPLSTYTTDIVSKISAWPVVARAALMHRPPPRATSLMAIAMAAAALSTSSACTAVAARPPAAAAAAAASTAAAAVATLIASRLIRAATLCIINAVMLSIKCCILVAYLSA